MSGRLVSQPPVSSRRAVALPKGRDGVSCCMTAREPIHAPSRRPTSARSPTRTTQRCSSYRCNATPRLAPSSARIACQRVDTRPTPRRSPTQTPHRGAQHERKLTAASLALLQGMGSKSAIVGGPSADLAAARAAHKERIQAVERSQNFTHAMMEKIAALRVDLASCSTTCSAASPSTSSLSDDSSSPRESP
eukprot:CAMPEP_0115267678 /NCGR_PEP_ID=MMETSP0270-20121206/52119_1 /TAXON_ID=71861 /ORGANISM="Scrippsiella trochoidea, Strain CCMP3099" /LENGTH=191 /DNA_ID=CAMNT_0002683837 /DNA_START=96 /DNA_END=671 /DNA_ORIENTATION=-